MTRLSDVIANRDGLYAGDLVPYFGALMRHARNLQNPYHNFRHMLHVTWLCYKACEYYRDRLTPIGMRTLLIAALFHDYDHRGVSGNDDLNIALAVEGLRRHLLPEDQPIAGAIESLIRTTEYPHQVPDDALTLMGRILRDADLSQALTEAWIQQVVFGLAEEGGFSPIEMLARQKAFLSGQRFLTAWAEAQFGQDALAEKIAEAEALLSFVQ